VLPLIPLFPFAGFLVNAALGRRLSKNASGLIATGAMGLSFGVSVAAVWRLLNVEPVGGVRAFQ
jgi:NADH:ubiquinone oxidoreductase subunit 5 (subunit L)/multisubunit Na+/H+ antiporter MnhA subunit